MLLSPMKRGSSCSIAIRHDHRTFLSLMLSNAVFVISPSKILLIISLSAEPCFSDDDDDDDDDDDGGGGDGDGDGDGDSDNYD